MQKPIFGNLKKIKHNKGIDRKEFIQDMVYIGIGISLLNIVTSEEVKLSGEIISLHKNKNRKEIAKIKESYNILQKKQVFVYSLLEIKDLATVRYRISQTNNAFVSLISESKHSISLELIAVYILYLGLNRTTRRTVLHEQLKTFCDCNIIFKKIADVIENAGVEEGDEYRISEKFVSIIRVNKNKN